MFSGFLPGGLFYLRSNLKSKELKIQKCSLLKPGVASADFLLKSL